ncbi:MAG: kelch repeat-containing protein [Kineosporiaceae bacterium]
MRVEATGGRRAGQAVLGAVLVMLATLLGGCLVPSPSEPTPTATRTAGAAGSKKIFLLRLIGICAGVNTFAAQKTEKDPEGPPPGAVADHLESLIGAAVASAPNVDRDKLQQLVARLSDLVGALRNKQQVDPADTERVAAAAKAVQAAHDQADKAAVSYGMPHLDDCNKSMQQDQVQQWRQLPSLPLAVQQIATAVVNGRIWVVGGLTGQDQASAKTFYFDPALETWFDGPPLPTPVSHAMAVAYHNTLVVFGGWIPIGAKIRGTTSAQVLRLQGDAWEPLASLNRPRAAGAAAVVGDRIVVVGGIDRDPVTTTEVFDGSTWRDGAAIPVPGDHLAAVSDGKALYAVGGRKNLDPTQSTAALQRYDPAANTWKRLADMLTPRGGLAAAYADGRIYAVGGETVSSARNVVESYDVAADSWTPATTLPVGLHGLGVAVVGGTLYAIGGATEAGHSNSTAAVLGLSLSGPAGASVTVAGVASSDLSACPERMAVHWACLSSARLRSDGGLDIRYRTNFGPSAQQDPQHQHLHVFTARPDGHGGTIPAASAMQGDAGAQQGSWVTLYARDVAVIPRGARTSGTQRPLDTSAPLLCVRVAIGIHSLDKDLSGGLNTGNCVTIQR